MQVNTQPANLRRRHLAAPNKSGTAKTLLDMLRELLNHWSKCHHSGWGGITDHAALKILGGFSRIGFRLHKEATLKKF
jgi:hypothetical protein